jgi:fructan beta-fructosidase
MQNMTKRIPSTALSPSELQQSWRPQLHFAPPAHWANDPNALYFDGKRFRLLFQYRDDSPAYRERCVWAAASSEDLAHWQFEGVALDAGDERAAYSGCAIQDAARPHELQAFWTEHRTRPSPEQCIRSATTVDGGQTFTSDKRVCVSRGSANFRDPFVFWHAPNARWIMLVAEACDWGAVEGRDRSCLHVYHSADLRRWIWASQIGPWDAPAIMWEVPQLVSVNVDGRQTWCLIISTVDRAGDASWCSVRYRFGKFDGERFEPEHAEDTWWSSSRRIGGTPLDYGPDFYAAIVSSSGAGASDADAIRAVAWMSNWRDARAFPWQDFAGGPMTSPRTLSAYVDAEGNARIRQRLTAAIWHSGGELAFAADAVRIGRSAVELAACASLCFVVEASFGVLAAGSRIELLLVGCDDTSEAAVPWTLTITDADVSLVRDSATDEWTRGGSTRPTVALRKRRGPVKVMILIDHCTSEVFVDDGEVVISSLFFPLHRQRRLCARYTQDRNRVDRDLVPEIEARAVTIRTLK